MNEQIQWRKDTLSKKSCWENWISIYKRDSLDIDHIPYIKINSKQIQISMIMQNYKISRRKHRKST